MELHDFNNLLHKLRANEDWVEFEGEEHILTASFHHGHFWCSINEAIFFRNKSLKTFRDKLMFHVQDKNLELKQQSKTNQQ